MFNSPIDWLFHMQAMGGARRRLPQGRPEPAMPSHGNPAKSYGCNELRTGPYVT